jgi:hypothetical protein
MIGRIDTLRQPRAGKNCHRGAAVTKRQDTRTVWSKPALRPRTWPVKNFCATTTRGRNFRAIGRQAQDSYNNSRFLAGSGEFMLSFEGFPKQLYRRNHLMTVAAGRAGGIQRDRRRHADSD